MCFNGSLVWSFRLESVDLIHTLWYLFSSNVSFTGIATIVIGSLSFEEDLWLLHLCHRGDFGPLQYGLPVLLWITSRFFLQHYSGSWMYSNSFSFVPCFNIIQWLEMWLLGRIINTPVLVGRVTALLRKCVGGKDGAWGEEKQSNASLHLYLAWS